MYASSFSSSLSSRTLVAVKPIMYSAWSSLISRKWAGDAALCASSSTRVLYRMERSSLAYAVRGLARKDAYVATTTSGVHDDRMLDLYCTTPPPSNVEKSQSIGHWSDRG